MSAQPKLTPGQLEVLERIAIGQTRKAIAAERGGSVKTVDYHWNGIKAALGVDTEVLAAHWAIKHRIVPLMFALLLMVIPASAQKGATLLMQPSLAAAAAAPAVGDSISLSWDPSTEAVAGYRLYASTNETVWRILATTAGLHLTVTNIFMPQSFKLTSYRGTGEESDRFSNTLRFTGKELRAVVWGQHAPTISDTWTRYPTPVFDGPITNASEVYRLEIERTNKWVKVSLP